MPELPEVETTKRGIAPHVENRVVDRCIVRERRFRWPIPEGLEQRLQGQRVGTLRRRGKYLIAPIGPGYLLLHLGMSGSLRVVDADSAPRKHDHVDWVFGQRALRFHDPRRFGAVLWTETPDEHPLLASLGPEPLSDDFNPDYLFRATRKRQQPIKTRIMDSHVVVGVGNIYASEALFLAGIRPGRAAARIRKAEAEALSQAIKTVLASAIEQGGTTLRDFVREDGQPGYFAQSLNVYGRQGQSCTQCGTVIKQKTLGQRSSFYCPSCQQ